MLLANILIVVMSLFFQGKYFPEQATPVENELDTLALPAEHPEVVLARRAMSAHGLCPSSPTQEKDPVTDTDSTGATPASNGLASNCF
jgi:hypothetical protein